MGYEKTVWTTGDVITQSLANKWETQYDHAKDDLEDHSSKETLDHPDGSVTDEKIGQRTVDDSIGPTDNTGLLSLIINWFASQIKSITGNDDWKVGPDTNLKEVKEHYSESSGVHGVGDSQVESTSGSQLKANTAESNAKDYADQQTDAVQSNLNDHNSQETLDHPDGSVTDSKIGQRTVNDSVGPTDSNSGLLSLIINWFANRIKAITGEDGWKVGPDTNLKEAKEHYSESSGVHGVGESKVESTSGSQSKANQAESNAKDYANQQANAVQSDLDSHKGDTSNPHEVTPSQIGALGNKSNIEDYLDFGNSYRVGYDDEQKAFFVEVI
ncbi:hypothetical protein [Natroniella sp. ANB-PHB2]|uniref:hypothetical protein n=1 Tax=Natroniella sp. ANB-PHB2 TaxID=3384444 RepID=UPI0038D3A9C0